MVVDVVGARLVEGAFERGFSVLGPRNPAARTPSTAIACPDAHTVETRMRERGIIASARGDAIRLAPHFYTTLDDVETALDALVEVMAGAATA